MILLQPLFANCRLKSAFLLIFSTACCIVVQKWRFFFAGPF